MNDYKTLENLSKEIGKSYKQIVSRSLIDYFGTVEKLDLSNYKLTNIPKSIYELKGLKELNLSSNLIEEVDNFGLGKIFLINLSDNLLSKESIENLNNIEGSLVDKCRGKGPHIKT